LVTGTLLLAGAGLAQDAPTQNVAKAKQDYEKAKQEYEKAAEKVKDAGNRDGATPKDIAPVPPPDQRDRPEIGAALIEVTRFIRATEARNGFQVDGQGLTAAVLDTGLRVTHVDFAGAGRVPTGNNFTTSDGGNPAVVTDRNGHGTNVAGIIAAHQDHTGIAPGANIIPLKVLRDDGGGNFTSIRDALQWVIDNRTTFNISVVNMSLGDVGNYSDDGQFAMDEIRQRAKILRDARVAVVVAAGNEYFRFNPKPNNGGSTPSVQEGMGYPGIFRETVSVGAVYDSDAGSFAYQSGAQANSTDEGRITPFSQRLHGSVNRAARTDILAPGAPVTSSGIQNDRGESTDHGTSQAAPVTAGVILLMQQYHLRTRGTLPSVDDLEKWIRRGGRNIRDGDDEDDNVLHTNKTFVRLDAFGALSAVKREIQVQRLQPVQGLRRVD